MQKYNNVISHFRWEMKEESVVLCTKMIHLYMTIIASIMKFQWIQMDKYSSYSS